MRGLEDWEEGLHRGLAVEGGKADLRSKACPAGKTNTNLAPTCHKKSGRHTPAAARFSGGVAFVAFSTEVGWPSKGRERNVVH